MPPDPPISPSVPGDPPPPGEGAGGIRDSEAGSRPATRTRRFGCLAFLLGSALAGVIGEVALRLWDHPFSNRRERIRFLRASEIPGLDYELIPGIRGEAWLTPVRLNSHGFRGPDWPAGPPAPGGPKRVLVLGDSVSFGMFVPEEDAWPSRLVGEAARHGQDLEVRNLSVTGYDPVSEALVLEHRGIAMQPSLVLLGLCLNDIALARDDLTARERIDRWHASPVAASRLLELGIYGLEVGYLCLDYLLVNRPKAFRRRFGDWIRPLPDDPGLEELRARAGTRNPTLADHWQDVEKLGRLHGAFTALGEMGRTHGFEVAVVILPYLVDGSPRYPFEPQHALAARLATRAGLGVVDLAPLLAPGGLRRHRVLPFDDIHPDPAGHHRIAAAVAEHLWGGSRP